MTTPQVLLGWADAAVAHPDFGPDGVWPRVAAFLCRQALEEALDRYWARELPGVERASRRTQISCLAPVLGDPDLAYDVATAWYALTRACHHHPYELAPTTAELAHWAAQVRTLVDRLG